MSNQRFSFLRVLSSPKTSNPDVWVATCLETGYVAAGHTYEEARDQMLEILRGEVMFARKNNNMGGLFRPIPQELIDRWEAAIRDNPPEELSLFPDQDGTEVEMARAA